MLQFPRLPRRHVALRALRAFIIRFERTSIDDAAPRRAAPGAVIAVTKRARKAPSGAYFVMRVKGSANRT